MLKKVNIDFTNIEYLKRGNNQQKLAYFEIVKLGIFEKLKNYNPLLTGTIPIEIDLPESDLDIICECENHKEFSKLLIKNFGDKMDFKINVTELNGIKSTVVEFKTDNYTFEIFGQNVPTEKQNAYRHMIVEHWILEQKGTEFKNEIKILKSKGIKTEPAFAKALGLNGNPYNEILNLEKKTIGNIV